MIKTWAVTWHLDGEAHTEGHLTEDEARWLADDLRSVDPGAAAADMLPPLAARFPVGTRVRNTDGNTGTVAAQGPDGVFNTERSAHTIIWPGEEAVSVVWDGGSGFPSWTVASYVKSAGDSA